MGEHHDEDRPGAQSVYDRIFLLIHEARVLYRGRSDKKIAILVV